jgi:pimeloyl-ACP methyl ester carboxylesterase
MKQLADIIAENGHDVYVVPKLGSNLLSIPESAALVNELINEKDLSNVVLLAHSKGGLIGKYLIINNNEDRRIKKLIAIATPFSGSTRGKLVPHKALKELLPTSELIKELQSNIEVNKDIISITPMHDNHIIAPTGSFLDGATNIRVDVSGHHRVLYDKAVISKILELFKFE